MLKPVSCDSAVIRKTCVCLFNTVSSTEANGLEFKKGHNKYIKKKKKNKTTAKKKKNKKKDISV